MNTLKKCEWNEIKVGEVFAVNGCWIIAYKESKNSIMALACDSPLRDFAGDIFNLIFDNLNFINKNGSSISLQNRYLYNLFKLPKSVQNNWLK